MNFVSRSLGAGCLALILAGCGKEEVKTYRVAKETAPPPVAATENPHAANPHGAMAAPARIEYKTPAGWETKPGGTMRAASFAIAGPEGLVADVAVIPMPGTAAPVGDMVNMWRSQLGLEQIQGEAGAKSAEAAEVAGGTAALFDLTSADNLIENKHKARIVGVVLPRGDATWFFKLAGEDAHVTSQKAAFKEFLKSVAFLEGAAAAPALAAGGAMPPMGGMGPGTLPPGADNAPAKPQWTVPAGWKEEPPTQMLVAKFSAADQAAKADITVSAFPGDVGGLLANVNRWRRQIGLPPMAEADVTKEVKQLDSVPGKMMLVELTGTDPKTSQPARLVGIIVPQAGQTWFYKLMGDPAVVGTQKDVLVQFARSAKYDMFLDRLVSFFTSLKLTVALLVLGLLLVFIGTLAQVELGLYEVQSRFFQSFFATWGPAGASWKIPVFPGGYLIGGLLIINLICSLIKIGFNPKKLGIIVIHLGLILLLLGQLATDKLAREGILHLRLGETKSYSESDRRLELAITEGSDPDLANVIAVPDSRLVNGETLDLGLPFRIKVRQFMPNSSLARQPVDGFEKTPATAGTGVGLWYREQPPTTKMNERDVPSALVDLEQPDGTKLGTWLLSNYFDAPEHVAVGGKHYDLALRLRRYYKPFSLSLQEFRHDVYKGTDIPKNFSSLVRLNNPETRESREVKIYMNNPLRYGGYTFYQSGFDPDNQGSSLQVVRNPSWLTPYLACLIVGGGLLLQFLMHLIPFLKRKL